MEDKEDLIKKLSELNNILSDMTDEKKPSKGKPSEKAASSDHAPKRSESEGSEHPARPREAARVHKPFRLPEEDPAPKTEPAESETAEPVPDPGDEAVEQPSAPPPPRKAPEPAAPRQAQQPAPPARAETTELPEESSSYLDEGLAADEMIILDEESRQESDEEASLEALTPLLQEEEYPAPDAPAAPAPSIHEKPLKPSEHPAASIPSKPAEHPISEALSAEEKKPAETEEEDVLPFVEIDLADLGKEKGGKRKEAGKVTDLPQAAKPEPIEITDLPRREPPREIEISDLHDIAVPRKKIEIPLDQPQRRPPAKEPLDIAPDVPGPKKPAASAPDGGVEIVNPFERKTFKEDIRKDPNVVPLDERTDIEDFYHALAKSDDSGAVKPAAEKPPVKSSAENAPVSPGPAPDVPSVPDRKPPSQPPAPPQPAGPAPAAEETEDDKKGRLNRFRQAFFSGSPAGDLSKIAKPGMKSSIEAGKEDIFIDEDVEKEIFRLALFCPAGRKDLIDAFYQNLYNMVKKTIKKDFHLDPVISEEIDYTALYKPHVSEKIDFTFLNIDAIFKRCRANTIDAIYFITEDPITISRKGIYFQVVTADEVSKRALFVDFSLNLMLVKNQKKDGKQP